MKLIKIVNISLCLTYINLNYIFYFCCQIFQMNSQEEFPFILTIFNSLKSNSLTIEQNIENIDLEMKKLVEEANHYIQLSEKINKEAQNGCISPIAKIQGENAEKIKLLAQIAKQDEIKNEFENYDNAIKARLENHEKEIKKFMESS